ncbi:MAG: DUF3109 family protein [Lentimicrobiaceae bacterium]|nr:DUF3109 family protein [Lentimicrobiaceae bacterium]MCB9023997.1 DUF3109 family protein [Lentimicrobiaceae bacterium]MCO5265608.1 DUF3109 family protein [Lentimicrobium sp.]HPG32226.1 DUF3109 family protein [Lentimicrobium sp.]
MIAIDDTINSDDLGKVCFVCDLMKCKGACCVEGDAGAPLEESEIGELEDSLDYIKPFMRQDGLEIVEHLGVFDYDAFGHYVTPLVNGAECAFVVFSEDGIAGCAIEKAWEAGKSKFRKPVSCHLYPVRINRYNDFDAVNYHQWHICQPALELGKRLNVPMYVFLKDSLVRKYGEKWYAQLCDGIEAQKNTEK